MANIGKIQLSDELLLKFLDFYPEGRILEVQHSNFNSITELLLEHPDIPKVEGEIPIVSPIYFTTQDALGHSVTRRKQGKVS